MATYFHHNAQTLQCDGSFYDARVTRNGPRVGAALKFDNGFAVLVAAGNDASDPLTFGTIGASDDPRSDGGYDRVSVLVTNGSDIVVGYKFPGEPAENLSGFDCARVLAAVAALPTWYGRDTFDEYA